MSTKKARKGKVIFATPFLLRPTDQYMASLEASLPFIEEAGYEHGMVQEIGNCYVSNARANCLRKALNGEPDMIVFLDYDLSWKPEHLLKLIETPGEVVAGTYRFKKEEVEYMGRTDEVAGKAIVRDDGCIKMIHTPAGFLKIQRTAINKFMQWFPELVYGEPTYPYVDMFNHGVIKWRDKGEDRVTWFGEDYAFAHRWRIISSGELWCQPDLDITHHHKETKPDGTVVWHDFAGNFHEYLCRLPGGSKDPARLKAKEALEKPEVLAFLDQLKSELTTKEAA